MTLPTPTGTTAPTELAAACLCTWTADSADARRAAIEALWEPDGRLVVSGLESALEGFEAIAAHVGGVHDDLIAGKGLVFRYDQQVDAPGSHLLRWSMLAPTGEVVGRGSDVVVLSERGRVATTYMFTGVN